MANNTGKVTCLICDRVVKDHETIKHRNRGMSDIYGYCKVCVHAKYNQDKSPQDILRMLNIPYIATLWYDVLAKHKDKALSAYFKAIAPKRQQYKDFLDSDFSDDSQKNTFQVTEKVIGRWGTSLSISQYQELEIKYEMLTKIKPPTTVLEESLYRDNVLIGVRLADALKTGQASDIEKLRKLYSSDLKALGLDLVKSNMDEVEAFGKRIAYWELTEPIPEMSSEFKDVDRIGRYLRKFFQIPFKRAMGVATKEEVEELYERDADIIPRLSSDNEEDDD